MRLSVVNAYECVYLVSRHTGVFTGFSGVRVCLTSITMYECIDRVAIMTGCYFYGCAYRVLRYMPTSVLNWCPVYECGVRVCSPGVTFGTAYESYTMCKQRVLIGCCGTRVCSPGITVYECECWVHGVRVYLLGVALYERVCFVSLITCIIYRVGRSTCLV